MGHTSYMIRRPSPCGFSNFQLQHSTDQFQAWGRRMRTATPRPLLLLLPLLQIERQALVAQADQRLPTPTLVKPLRARGCPAQMPHGTSAPPLTDRTCLRPSSRSLKSIPWVNPLGIGERSRRSNEPVEELVGNRRRISLSLVGFTASRMPTTMPCNTRSLCYRHEGTNNH